MGLEPSLQYVDKLKPFAQPQLNGLPHPRVGVAIAFSQHFMSPHESQLFKS